MLLLYQRIENELIVGCIFLLLEYPRIFVALIIHVINQIMNGWWFTKIVVYFIQYVTLKYNYTD
jgi:hypothetical protein